MSIQHVAARNVAETYETPRLEPPRSRRGLPAGRSGSDRGNFMCSNCSSNT